MRLRPLILIFLTLFFLSCQTVSSLFRSAIPAVESATVPAESFARGFHGTVATHKYVYIFGGMSDDSSVLPPVIASGWTYDVHDQTWQPLPRDNQPSPRFGHGMAAGEHWLLIWGGQGAGDQYLDDGALFNIKTQRWQTLPPAPIKSRRHVEVRWTGQEFILIGGQSSLAGDASVAAFDPTTLKWRLLDSLPQGEVFGHSVVKIANHLLVWGGMGRNGRAPFGSTLDLHTGTWEQLSTMQQPKLRSNHTAAVIDGKMFIWGGADGSGKLNSGALYNPAIRRWTDAVITADIEPRSGHAMVTVNNGVLVWGGRDGKNHFLNDGAFFDFTLGTWSKFSPNQISARALHTLVAVNNRALLIGGFGPGEHFTLRYFGDAYWLLPPDANAEQYSFCHEESCRG